MATELLLSPETIAPWTTAQLRSAQKDHLERAQVIEARYGDREIPHDEEAQIKNLLATVELLENAESAKAAREGQQSMIQEKLLGLNQPSHRAPLPQRGDMQRGPATPGQQFVTSKEYLTLKQGGAFDSALTRAEFGVQLKEGYSLLDWRNPMQQKTTLTEGAAVTGGGFVIPDYRPGYIDLPQRPITLLPLIPRLQTGSDVVSYVQQTGYTISAALVAEASGSAQTGTDGRKPESALAFNTVTTNVLTLAHWIPVTNQLLSDAPAIRGVVDSQLMLGLELTLESQVIGGTGTLQLTGLLNTSGINVQGKGADSDLDAIFKGANLVRTVGFGTPSVIALNATDFATVRLAREGVSTGTYLMGPPNLAGPMSMWGIPVVISQALTQGTGLIMDAAQAAAIMDREQAAIRVGTINDQMIRNQQTILAEQRLALAVWRPALVTKVTGL